MTETCPSCRGKRVPDDPDALSTFQHTPSCELLAAEQETLRTDLKRYRGGVLSRHRAATDAERELVRASGLHVHRSAPLFVRVELVAHDLRLRLLPAVGLASVTEVSS